MHWHFPSVCVVRCASLQTVSCTHTHTRAHHACFPFIDEKVNGIVEAAIIHNTGDWRGKSAYTYISVPKMLSVQKTRHFSHSTLTFLPRYANTHILVLGAPLFSIPLRMLVFSRAALSKSHLKNWKESLIYNLNGHKYPINVICTICSLLLLLFLATLLPPYYSCEHRELLCICMCVVCVCVKPLISLLNDVYRCGCSA